MATTYTVVPDGRDFRDAQQRVITYAALGNESGDWFRYPEYPDKTITVYGTGTVTVEGSADGVHAIALKDQTGAAISLVVAGTSASAFILENPVFMRVVNNNATGVIATVTCSK